MNRSKQHLASPRGLKYCPAMSSHPPRGTPTAASRAEGTRAALCIVAALIASVLLASCFPLLDPDEGRNAEIAREMARSGSLLVPTLEGMPYLDKPPGFFWVDALAIRGRGGAYVVAGLETGAWSTARQCRSPRRGPARHRSLVRDPLRLRDL